MHDERFYRTLGPLSANAIADLVGATLRGEGARSLLTVCSPNNPADNALCFFEGDPRDAGKIDPSMGAVITNEQCAEAIADGITVLISKTPRVDFTRAAACLLESIAVTDNRDGAALKAAVQHDGVTIGPGAFIGVGASIGAGTVIGPNAVIGPGVQIGRGCSIGSGTVIEAALIGDNVRIKSNAVIGGFGFGLVPEAEGFSEAPHFGRVIIQDKVAIGSCTCIDRGAFEDTVIGEGTKIDNLVQVGHNSTFGRHSVVAAFGGISGSVNIGNGVMLGGRVGIADHLNIGDGSKLAADAAVMRDVPPGEVWGGTPAKPLRQMLREAAWLSRSAKRRSTGNDTTS